MKKPRKDTLSTRRQMIDAAETLFAEKGIDNVSLVDISRAAGQKNRSALQYHFGDKAGLINAVLDKHSADIAVTRGEMLDALELSVEFTVRDAVRALVIPVAEQLENREGGQAFLNINSQMMSSRAYADLRLQRVPQLAEAQRLSSIFREKIQTDDPGEIAARMQIVDCMLFHSLSAYSSRPGGVPRQKFVETLIDSITAVIAAD